MPNVSLCTHSVVVHTQEMVTGYTDDGLMVLTCEVYGYLRSNNPTVRWLRETRGTRQLLQNTSPKYAVEYGSGFRLAQNPDGITRQSIVANLTIHQLAITDNGTYICGIVGEQEEGAAEVTVMPGSRPTEETLGNGGTPTTEVTEVATTTLGGSTG